MKRIFAALLCALTLLSLNSCFTLDRYESSKSAYDGIIEEYTALLTAKQNGEELPEPDTKGMDEREAAIAEALYGIVADQKAETLADLGYGFKDMDGNGTPELILLTRYTSIRAVFTIANRKPVLLEANYGEGAVFLFATKNRFFMERSTVDGSIRDATLYTCHVEGDRMVYDAVYGEVYDQEKKETLELYQMVDGNRTVIDKEAFNELYRERRQTIDTEYGRTVKLFSPYIHYPLGEKVSTENLPVADFSSYEAIRETYKAISTCLDGNLWGDDWLMGAYDNLFTYPDDRSFEYYSQLLYTAYEGGYNEGYDEIDLNGDGVDELVILNEDYIIKAIFTMKNGKPVMLDALTHENGWLDSEGFIHVDREDEYMLEYSLYELTADGDYNLIYSILLAQYGNYYETNYYLTKEGKTEKITSDRFKEIYNDEYCVYTAPFEANEYNRAVSGLTYTPLTPPAEDLVRNAVTKRWYKGAWLNEIPVDAHSAYGAIYMSFENITETQMDVHVTYKYAVYYPDPDNQYHSLEDITESNLNFTARLENGVFVFEADGIKGHLEFSPKYLWLVIEESSDKRFPVGYHQLSEYVPGE